MKNLITIGFLCLLPASSQKLAQWPRASGAGWFAASYASEYCEPITASVYKLGRWQPATCSDIMEVLNKQRDIRGVTMAMAPSVSDFLTYSQYEYAFRIKREDFQAAQAKCRELLENESAHPDILAQCRLTVKGVVPYGLKLADSR